MNKYIIAKDKNGVELKEGDICEVTVKYEVVKVVAEDYVLVRKLYDITSGALTKTGATTK